MDDPTRRNRLDDAASPYLRQHADNPVAWQPWDDRALEAAEERDVPIFLSIGYAACHWCHVMAEESFQDETVAEILNEHYVPIKVDREERPDVDSVYMTACRLVRGGGGWPLSVWLTPDRDPFHVATYLPRNPRPGQPGFVDVLEDIADGWTDPDRRRQFEQRADRLATAIADDLENVPDAEPSRDEDLVVQAAQSVMDAADRVNGGFGDAPKFPHPGRVQLLFRVADRLDAGDPVQIATDALDAMADGGLYDHVGGGFHRYCTDATWTVPHYEKMLYDNAELPLAYLDGYRITGEDRYARVVEDTLAFIDRELGADDGGFYSTLSARAGDVEGAYYTWTPAEIESAIATADVSNPDQLTSLTLDHWGVTPGGNTEEGRTVLTISEPIATLADAHDRPTDAVADDLETARELLADARAERDRPPRDEKILAGWNGLAITAFAEAGLALDPDYTDRAEAALSFIHSQLWDGEELRRRYHHGDVGIPGYLEDYAYLARGALRCYEATGDPDHLAFAIDLGHEIRDRFWDADTETFYFTPEGGETLLARPQQLQDQSTPSSSGVAAQVLTTLSHVDPDAGFGDIARTLTHTHEPTISQSPLAHIALITAVDRQRRGPLEITVAGDLPDTWRELIGSTYLPDRFLTRRPRDADGLADWLETFGIDSPPPIWADRDATTDQATAYVCRRACSPPIHGRDDLEEWLAEFT